MFNIGQRVRTTRALEFEDGNRVSAGEKGKVASETEAGVVNVFFGSIGGNEPVNESDLVADGAGITAAAPTASVTTSAAASSSGFKIGQFVQAKRDLVFDDGTKVAADTKGTVAGSAPPPENVFVLFVGIAGVRPVRDPDLQPV